MKYVTFVDYSDDAWKIPAHVIAKEYARREAEKAGTIRSGLYHQAYFKAHRQILEDDALLRDFAHHDVDFGKIAQYAELQEPAASLAEIYYSADTVLLVEGNGNTSS